MKVCVNGNFEENREKMASVLLNDPFSKYLGIEIVEFSETKILGRIPMKKEHLNNYGSLHGGVLYSIADIMAGSLACAGGKYCTTVSGNLNYLEFAKGKEYVYCEGNIVRAGGKLIVVDVRITSDEGRVLDTGSFTFYRLDKNVIE